MLNQLVVMYNYCTTVLERILHEQDCARALPNVCWQIVTAEPLIDIHNGGRTPP